VSAVASLSVSTQAVVVSFALLVMLASAKF